MTVRIYFYTSKLTNMQKKYMHKHLSMRKQITLNETRPQCWPLPAEYIKVLLLLGIVRKIVKNLTNIIKKKQNKQNNQLQHLKKTYCGQINYFNIIAPVSKQFQQLMISKQAFTCLKKQLLSFLKIIKLSPDTKILLKKPQTINELIFNQTQTQLKMSCSKISKQNNFILDNQTQVQCYKVQTQPNHDPSKSEIIDLKVNNQSNYKYKLQPLGLRSDSDLNRVWNSARKLKERIKNQSAAFSKYNKSMANFCDYSTSCCTSKGYNELIQAYLISLLQTKNVTTAHMHNIMEQNTIIQTRIMYLTKQIVKISLDICKLAKPFFSSFKIKEDDSMQAIEKKCILFISSYDFQNQMQNVRLSQKCLTQFIKILGNVIEISKNFMFFSKYKFDKIDQKSFINLISKLADFRYIAKYIHSQISCIGKFKKAQTRNQNQDVQIRWRRIYNKKYGKCINIKKL